MRLEKSLASTESVAESFETEKLSWSPLALKLAVLIITVHHQHLPKMFKLWEWDVAELGVLTNLGVNLCLVQA